MLNMKAMPAAGGAGLAAYLWKEAISHDAHEPWVAKSALDLWVAAGAGYEDLIDCAYRLRLARARATIVPEPHHALHGLSDVGIDHELLRDKAEQDVMAALDLYEAGPRSGVSYRQDTPSELAALLKINLAASPSLPGLQHLLSGMAADGQRIEGRFYRRDRPDQMMMGSLELIFSADKSISSVFGLASREERRAITMMQERSVDTAMRAIAGQIGRIRSRRDGVDKRDPADLTWIQWQHRQSRRGDPQLHTHVTMLNVVRSRVDGKVGTLDTFLLHGFYPKAREIYHRSLAAELDKLGMEVKFDSRVPAAVLTNVPEIVVRHFSGRAADAEALASKWLEENRGVSFASLTEKQRSQWLTRAAAASRPPKAMYYVPGNGHAAWHARATGQGYIPPPHFVDPYYLQRAGIVHATMEQPEHTPTISQEATKVDPHRQSKSANPRLDSRYNKGGGKYDEDSTRRRGLRV